MNAIEAASFQKLNRLARPGHNSGKGSSMYAIVFDLDTNTLANTYHGNSPNNAYYDIRKVLTGYGFDWQQGSTYFGGPSVDAVTCVLAVQDLAAQYAWFQPSVRDIRMLRIEENNDLMPAVERGARR
ncbi:MAG: virulence factor [Sandarakinorhabdus sp.]|jgi:virulence-associated protein VapD